MEISSQVQAAVVLDAAGDVVGAAGIGADGGRSLAGTARELLDRAATIRPAAGESGVTQLEAATRAGSVFLVREGERVIAATTGRAPTVGLVFYDLKTCLRALAAEVPKSEPAKPKAKPKTPRERGAAAGKDEHESP